MFDEARDEEAVLLLDEADSFLQDRTLAHRQWEVTEVNELLTQMEGFDGLFICTNLLDHLDPAALRRFGLKLEFLALRPEQASSLYHHAN
jgi:transitional endoplasmic reticulum ATPase